MMMFKARQETVFEMTEDTFLSFLAAYVTRLGKFLLLGHCLSAFSIGIYFLKRNEVFVDFQCS